MALQSQDVVSHGKGFQQKFSIFEIFDPPSHILPWILKNTVPKGKSLTVNLRIQGKICGGGSKISKIKKIC